MTNTNPTHTFSRLAVAALALGAFIIGFSAIFVRLSPVGPTVTAFYRLAFSLPLFAFLLAAAHVLPPADSVSAMGARRPRLALLLPGLFFACDIGIWHWALQYTYVSNSTLLGNLAPIVVTLIAWRFFHERITRLFLCGLFTALLGTVLLMSNSLRLSAATFFGDALSMTTAFFYAGYLLSMNRLRRHYSTLAVMTANCLIGSIPLLAVALLLGENLAWNGDAFVQGLLVLLALALVCHFGGQGLIVYALKKLPASFSSVTLLIQPVVAAIAAWILLGEALGGLQMAGGMVVLAGIFLAQRGSLGPRGTT